MICEGFQQHVAKVFAANLIASPYFICQYHAVFDAVKFDAENQCAAWLKIHKHTHTPAAAGVCLGTHLD